MPHIHTHSGEHDATASAYIVRTDTPEPTLMLHRHKKLGAWLQFGGHIEPKENPWQAIAHELREESGYEMSQLMVLQPKHSIRRMSAVALHPIPIIPFTHKFPGLDHYHNDGGYGFVTDQEPLDQPQKGESNVFACFTVEQLKQIPNNEIPLNLVETGEYLLTIALKHYEQIPASEWSLDTPTAHFE